MIFEITSAPIYVALAYAPQPQIPYDFPCGMPHNFVPEGYQPAIEVHAA